MQNWEYLILINLVNYFYYNGELNITLEKIKAVYTKMHIADLNFDLTYS